MLMTAGSTEKLILDTHVWLWAAIDSQQLSTAAKARIEACGQNGGLYFSPISCWEIAKLTNKGRLKLPIPVRQWLTDAIELMLMQCIPIDANIAIEAETLVNAPNKDPADRFLIATARHYNIPLATRDTLLLDYSEQGHVSAFAV
jgi:PIN domain nuclease of toxin-antitoxin system